MDKRIVEALAKKGIISKININPDKYENVDDLFKKGVISKPGAKPMVERILAELNLVEKPVDDVIVPETDVVDTHTDETDTIDVVDVVDEVVIDEVDEADVPADAEVVDEIVVDEVEEPVVEETKPSKKGSKKSE